MEGHSDVKKPLKLKILYRGKPPEGAAAAPSPPTCSLCARTFFSLKALHGHMRWHRALPLPAPLMTQKPSSLVDTPPRLEPLLGTWYRAAKRTRLVPVERDPKSFDGMEDGDGMGAADDHESTSEICTDASAVASDEDMDILGHCGQTSKTSGAPPRHCDCDCDCCRRWRPPPCAPVGYACVPCGRAFTSRQALCGHMASHGKQRDSTRDESPWEGNPKASKRRHVKEANSSAHRCNVCGRVFATGQALGGHKRLHWEGPEICHTLALFPPALTAPGDMKNTSARVRDFDLNDVPVVEDGAEGNPRELQLLA